MNTKEKMELVYDGECPVCRTYCENVRLADNGGQLELIDARKPGPVMDLITEKGLDIDEGMVLKVGDKLFYGSDAVSELSKYSGFGNPIGIINLLFFRSRLLARVFYPAGKQVRNAVLYLLGIEKIRNLKSGSAIRNQMKDRWFTLHENIRERFAKDPVPGKKIIFEGTMQTIRCSTMGCVFAHLTRVIGNPLSPYRGTDVPMEVMLSKKSGKNGVYWQRTYHYPGRKPYVVSSLKRESDGKMMECVGGGFGMLLDVHGQDRELHFESRRYFWQFLFLRVPLPHWLSPGKTHVIHTDLGGGDFRFTISMIYRQLGETFFQEGIFKLKKT